MENLTTKIMKKKINYFALFLVSLLLFNGCYNDKEETLYRFTTTCDTTNVTYTNTIAPIIQASCVSCHSGTSPSGSLSLINHGELVTAVNSKNLYARITSTTNPMPQSGLMDACKIEQIKKWIDSNMPNN